MFTSAHLHHHTSTFAHLHIWTSTSLLIFTSSHLHISHLHLSLFFTFSLKAGGGAAGAPRNATLCGDRALWRAQPSAEIVRVEGAKCRRDCVLSLPGATLCGDRACRGREMQARLRFVSARRNPLRRSCALRARNAGEIAFCLCPAQPSAEIARVEGAKCRRDCVLSGATLCGDRAGRGREMQARLRFVSARRNPLRRSCVSRARNAGEIAFWIWRATLCGDRAR